ncbi:MAG: sigma-70 family RNA polymerase sigma factor [Candidatus Omnitrophica bacterium]|nr:sigma-70 family RNA polymerase sigma factor [Candidatus Omnitrophota bacterium]
MRRFKPDPAGDRRLVEGCLRGEDFAWDNFIRRFSPLIFWAAQKRLKRWSIDLPWDEIDEIRQNLFLRIYEKCALKGLKKKERVAVWLALVTCNEVATYLRKNKYLRRPTPSHKILYSESAAISPKVSVLLEDALAALPHRERLIIKLKFMEKYSYRQISELIRIPIGTVAISLMRGKSKLRKELKKRGMEGSLK